MEVRKELEIKIQELVERKKYLENSLNAHFSADRKSTLNEIVLVDKKNFCFKPKTWKIKS